MNIQEAKDQIKSAVRAYLSKDPSGSYEIPRSRQRPILLMGAPGLGKTAIMGQIAAELDIGLVSYTITHHTRQSAIGLPMIDREVYDGTEYTVTRYTMSEIISSVYDAIRDQGKKEGILFIDEINCASETLAPSMLDLLQNKKFGPHRIPDGWILVSAGNPHEFNDSAREFDVATLDRVRMIEVQPDTDVWLRYAMDAGINDAVIYYLKIKPQNLLKIERTVDGRFYVTPRAWEDLSVVLNESEAEGIDEGLDLISQYIRDPEIAAEFARYRDFYRKYRSDVDVRTILSGAHQSVEGMDADGKLAVVTMLIDEINSEASELIGVQNASDPIRKKTDLAHSEFDRHLSNAISFMENNYGNGPETMFLLTGLLSCSSVVLLSTPSNPLYELNDRMLVRGRGRRMQEVGRWQ
ncbi:MAG: AAA family ATPase [Candidatus Methanomethylophilaceae archaeon]|nr:AAA family ATPase [Candidatus Methanomethylophilaceae archaeon]